MFVHEFSAFQRCPKGFFNSFSDLVTFTEKVQKNQYTLRQKELADFIERVPHLLMDSCQNQNGVNEKDFKRFDKAFSTLVSCQKQQEGLLETIYLIQTTVQRHFTKLKEGLCPILIKGPGNKQMLISKARLFSPIFQAMLSGGFYEAESHEITLPDLSRTGFDLFGAFLLDKEFSIPVEQISEILVFSHAYVLPKLFLKALSQIVSLLQQNNLQNLPHLKESLLILGNFAGYRQIETIQKSTISSLLEQFQDRASRFFNSLFSDATADNALDSSFKNLNLETQKDPPQNVNEPFFIYFLSQDSDLKNSCAKLLYTLAELYGTGYGVDKDPTEAAYLYKMAANLGLAYGQNAYGMCNEKGIGIAQNYQLAALWYGAAAKRGFARAQFNLGRLTFLGYGVPKDIKKAISFYTLAADQDIAEAQFLLGYFSIYGQHCPKNYALAATLLKKAGDLGHASAYYWLGYLHHKGLGCPQDLDRALQLYQQAADRGYGRAQYAVGQCYEKGEGFLQNSPLALHWYTLAAKSGYPRAQHTLGVCYDEGTLNCHKNALIARELFERAATAGFAPAQYSLGLFYKFGIIGQPDEEEGFSWFTRSAEQGYAPAQNSLGLCYYHGCGCNLSVNEAVACFRKAAEQKNPAAQNNLGLCLLLGQGAQVDFNEAANCFLKAALQKNEEGHHNLSLCHDYGQALSQVEHHARKLLKVAYEHYQLHSHPFYKWCPRR